MAETAAAVGGARQPGGHTRNLRWAMDLVQDALANGRVLRILTVEDTYTREGLAITVDASIPGLRVRRELDRLIGLHGSRRRLAWTTARR